MILSDFNYIWNICLAMSSIKVYKKKRVCLICQTNQILLPFRCILNPPFCMYASGNCLSKQAFADEIFLSPKRPLLGPRLVQKAHNKGHTFKRSRSEQPNTDTPYSHLQLGFFLKSDHRLLSVMETLVHEKSPIALDNLQHT